MEVIKKIFGNKNTLTFVLGALFVLLFLRQCNQVASLKQDVKYAQEDANISINNLLAAQDSVTVLKNDNGDQLAQIRSYKVDLSIKDNKLINSILITYSLNFFYESIN